MISEKQLAELSQNYDLAYGYVYQNDVRSEYCFENKPEYLASFIMTHPKADRIIITDSLDCLILNTIGTFIDRCPNQNLLQEILKTLLPMQLEGKQPLDFPCAEMDEFNDYCSAKEFEMDME
ncbi:MAG: resolvase [Brevinema sp.]